MSRREAKSNVFVLDAEGHPLDPVHPGYARRLLSYQKAAVVNDASGAVVWAAELTHRGQQVRKHLADRRAVRRSRRQRKTRYRMNESGFPRTRAKQQSRVRGFRTGDMVRAAVPTGTKAGTFAGRVAVRASGFFHVTTKARTIQGIATRSCQVIHHQDGYRYAKGEATSSRSPAGEGSPSPVSL